MAADCAIELRKHNVAVVSLWPNLVRTELVTEMFEKTAPSASGRKTDFNVSFFSAWSSCLPLIEIDLQSPVILY